MKHYNSLIFEVGKPGRRATQLPLWTGDLLSAEDIFGADMARTVDAELPEVSEIEAVRHYTTLSTKNFGVDNGFYPLGSCTMKYNPKVNEFTAALPGFYDLHPYQPVETAQGALELLGNLSTGLCEVTGMDAFSLQTAAGAHGELAGLMIIKAYHKKNGQTQRTKIIVPDSAHGTNPSSAAVAGFDIIEIKSAPDGSIDLDALKAVLGDDTAGFMLTNPSTLGLFEINIQEASKMIHDAGGLLYYDGANLNAIMGVTRPGDMGFDVMHVNLHKTFSTPHGGGGPGSGPVGVNSKLAEFLPVPVVEKTSTGNYILNSDKPYSIGRMKNFYGNFAINVRAYTYMLSLGGNGLTEASKTAVLNANYIMHRLKNHYNLPFDRDCMHECVFAGLKNTGGLVPTLDVAKRLLDFGYHPPTIYFPLIVDNAIMIEPTETESRETIDAFADAMIAIAEEAQTDPSILRNAPYTTNVRRVDEVLAARTPILRYTPVGR